MKNKTKLVATLMSMCLVLSFAVIGILAVKTLNMSVGGNITFNASGVSFTVGEGKFYKTDKTTLYSGITTQTGKMVGFKVDTNTTLESVSDEIATWAGLELKLDSQGDAVLKFNIKNDMSSTELKVGFAVTLGTNKNNNMNIVAPTLEAIAGGANKDIYITFDILDDTINAGLTGFKIAITIGDQNGAEATPILEVDASSGAVINPTETKYTNAKYNIKSIEDKTVTVSHSANNISGEVYIAEKVIIGGEEYTVVEVADNAFESCSAITNVVIPNTITRIGNEAFGNCSGLIGELVISESVTTVGSDAFYDCVGLTSLIIGSNANLQSRAFIDCSGLETITIKASRVLIIGYDDELAGAPWFLWYNECIIYVPSEVLESYLGTDPWYTIPDRIFAIPA